MILDITSYCRMIRPMQVYHSNTTRENEPAPEIRWIVGEDVRIMGFDEFKCQIRFSLVRLDGQECHVSGDNQTEFFTEVPATNNLDAVTNNTEVVIDTESSQSHLIVSTKDIQYKIKKVHGSEPLEFRQQYLPVNQPIAEGSILSRKLNKFINLSPGKSFKIRIVDDRIIFVSEADNGMSKYSFTDMCTVYSDAVEYGRPFALDIELFYSQIRKIPKNKQIDVIVTAEFIRLRYEIGDIGYMNYYQRIKNSRDIYV